jgi:hypothetical protein
MLPEAYYVLTNRLDCTNYLTGLSHTTTVRGSRTKKRDDWKKFQSFLLESNEETFQHMLENTTMQGNISGRVPQRMHLHSRNLWANIYCFLNSNQL